MKRQPKDRIRFNENKTLDSIIIYNWKQIESVLNKIEVNKVPDDRLEGIISAMIKILEKRKHNAMKRSDTDDFSIKIESLQWGSICYLC